jgi:3-oxoacyl-(acyl-carrier-protein) synthase
VIGVLSVGCVTPLGDDPREVRAALAAGRSGLRAHPVLSDLPDSRAGVVDGPDLGPWLRRRKDARLLARAAQLALPAAGRALAGPALDADSLGLYVAVGREPPDDGDAEACLVAAHRDGVLDPEALGTAGRDVYPPLLPLRTLPNMILAHVSIAHGIRGDNGTWAGGAEAGAQALAAAVHAVEEGRAPLALVGAAYAAVDLGSARDRLRLGAEGPPGEAAVFALVGPGGAPIPPAPDLRWAMGDCGPVAGLWGLLLADVASRAVSPC